MKKIITTLFIIGVMAIGHQAFAQTISLIRPTTISVDSIAATTAQVQVNVGTDEYKNLTQNRTAIKIQWRPWVCGDDQAANIACTLLYVVPFNTTLDYDAQGNLLPVVLTSLQPNTKYRVWVGYDNGIRCITTPCNSDTWQNATYSFTTAAGTSIPNPYPNVSLLTQRLIVGVRGAQVKILENFLATQGYMKLYVDSYYGTATRDAIMKFQKDHGLDVDGRVGPATRAVINSIINGGVVVSASASKN